MALAVAGALAGETAALASSSSSSAASGMGPRDGEREAGLTVPWLEDGRDWKYSSTREAPARREAAPSCELKRGCEKVRGVWRSASNVGAPLDTTPVPARRPRSCPASSLLSSCARRRAASRSLFLCSRLSTSRRLRSREDWAARRFLRTRSTRRCSFSSSVLARFLLWVRIVGGDGSLRSCLPRREVRLGLRELLPPRLPLLGLLLLGLGALGGRCGRREGGEGGDFGLAEVGKRLW